MSHAKIIGWEVDLDSIDAQIRRLSSEVVRGPASVFSQSLHDLDELSMVPLHAAGEGVRMFYWSIGYVRGPLKIATQVLNGDLSGLADLKRMETSEDRIRLANEWMTEYLKGSEVTSEMARFIDQSMDRLCERESFRSALSTINLMAVPALWTALECLARDLWIGVLNQSSNPILHRAFKLLERDEVAARAVSVSDLAKNGFDLRDKVGTILAPKYTFSDFEGIQKAFRVIRHESLQVPEPILRSLFTLEKTRHLLVHRAGYVDEKFKRETSSPKEVGSRVEIDALQVREWFGSVVVGGSKLIGAAEAVYANSTKA